MCSAVILFSVLDASAKYLATNLNVPVEQVIWLRFLSHIILTVFICGFHNLPRTIQSAKPFHQIMRSLFMLGATAFNFFAVKFLQLDQTITIFFLTPLIVAALAGPFLGEWVGWRRLAAILVGFLGIVIVFQPGFGGIHPAAILSLLAALSYALYSLQTRYLSAYDSTNTTMFLTPLAGGLLLTPFAIYNWQWPSDSFTWFLLLSLGISGGIGHNLLIIAHKYAPASTLSPFVYIGIISMTTIGYFIFNDIPSYGTLVGSIIVIGAGLYLIYRETKYAQT